MLKTVFQKIFELRESASRSRVRPGADDGYDAHEKPFLDHLEDLRHTLMKVGGTLAVSTLLCFGFHKQIFQLVQVPAKVKFAEISPGVSLWDKLDLITLGPPEFIVLMLKLSFFSGVIISFPFTIYFFFQFILPGLRQAEKRAVIPGSLIGFALFLIGAGFAFYIAAPVALKFFYLFENERISNIDPAARAMERPIAEISLIAVDGAKIPPLGAKGTPIPPEGTQGDAEGRALLTPEFRAEIRDYLRESFATAEGANFALRYDEAREKLVIVEAKGGKSIYRIGEYITFIARLVLVFGVSFQLPVVVTILVKLELLTARVMRSTRTYAWIIILVAAAILTPPDIFTLALLGGPMIFLYEVCIIIASIIEKGREKRLRAEEESRRTRLERLYLKPASELSEEEKAEIHRAEIAQYEAEHAHLYEEENDHGTQHDESWHADDHYWHEGHEGHEDDPHWHDPHSGMESDHAEPVDLEPADDPAANDLEFDSCVPDGPVVNLNHASEEELMTLPGIGPKMAATLIEHRPYLTFDDLDRVPGLGPEKIRRITERIMLG